MLVYCFFQTPSVGSIKIIPSLLQERKVRLRKFKYILLFPPNSVEEELKKIVVYIQSVQYNKLGIQYHIISSSHH